MLDPAYYAQVFTYNAFEHCFQKICSYYFIIILNKQTVLLEFIHELGIPVHMFTVRMFNKMTVLLE